MGLFSALSGKIYRFNSINIPIDNGIATKIQELDESNEKLVLLVAFGITQKMVGQILHPDHGIFKWSLNSLTKEKLEKIYYDLLSLSINYVAKLPLNFDKKNTITILANISCPTENIAKYNKTDSDIVNTYESISSVLGVRDNSRVVIFGNIYLKIYDEATKVLENLIWKD